MNKKVRAITEGAFMSALVGLLIVLDGQSGLLIDGLLFWIIPIPVIIYSIRHSLSAGLMVSTATTIMAFILTIPHIALLIGFSNIIGLAYAFSVKKEYPQAIVFSLTFGATAIYYILSMVIFAGFFGYDALAEISEITKMVTSIVHGLINEDVNVVKILYLYNPFFKMLTMFPLFLPLTIALLQTFITVMVSKIILTRLKLMEFAPVSIFKFKLNSWIGYPLMLFVIVTIIIEFSTNFHFDSVIMLVQFIGQLLFIYIGILCSLTIVIVKRVPLFSIVVALLTLSFPYVTMVIGMLDFVFNIRVLIVRKVLNER